jgi:hypothetical protein
MNDDKFTLVDKVRLPRASKQWWQLLQVAAYLGVFFVTIWIVCALIAP